MKVNIYNDYKLMGAFGVELYYKKIKKRRRILCTIPLVLLLAAAVMYGILGWASYIVLLSSAGKSSPNFIAAGVMRFAAYAVCAVMQSTNDRKLTISGAVIMAVYTFIAEPFAKWCLDLDGGIDVTTIILLALTLIAAYFHLKYIKEEEFIRNLPEEYKEPKKGAEIKIESAVKKAVEENVEKTDHVVYDSTKTEQVLSALPKRSYESYKFRQDEMDEIDESFEGDIKKTDRRFRKRPQMRDAGNKFKGDISRSSEPAEYVTQDEISLDYAGDISVLADPLSVNYTDSIEEVLPPAQENQN